MIFADATAALAPATTTPASPNAASLVVNAVKNAVQAAQAAQAAKDAQESFFDKYKTQLLVGGGVALAAGLGYAIWKSQKK